MSTEEHISTRWCPTQHTKDLKLNYTHICVEVKVNIEFFIALRKTISVGN